MLPMLTYTILLLLLTLSPYYVWFAHVLLSGCTLIWHEFYDLSPAWRQPSLDHISNTISLLLLNTCFFFDVYFSSSVFLVLGPYFYIINLSDNNTTHATIPQWDNRFIMSIPLVRYLLYVEAAIRKVYSEKHLQLYKVSVKWKKPAWLPRKRHKCCPLRKIVTKSSISYISVMKPT